MMTRNWQVCLLPRKKEVHLLFLVWLDVKFGSENVWRKRKEALLSWCCRGKGQKGIKKRKSQKSWVQEKRISTQGFMF